MSGLVDDCGVEKYIVDARHGLCQGLGQDEGGVLLTEVPH
jgi:hypothetical protein